MLEINKSEEKRKDAGEKIRSLWKSEGFSEKMKNRKPRNGIKLKLIDIYDNETIFDSMRIFRDFFNFSEHLIRKYRNTGKRISIDDLNNNNNQLEKCKIETIDGQDCRQKKNY